MALATILKAIYYFTQDDPQHRMMRALGINARLTSKICRRLQDVCSVDLQNRPFIPFGGSGTVVKCDESKFNHKPKVNVVKTRRIYKKYFQVSKHFVAVTRIARKTTKAKHGHKNILVE